MSNTPVNKGKFILSLDFELFWGMFDKVDAEKYEANLRGVRSAVPRLLRIFKEREIHATWATVGMLTSYHLNELENLSPLTHEKPMYERPELSAYWYLEKFRETIEDNLDLYLAPDLVEEILDTPGQELASHTFSHLYCLEAHQPRPDHHTGKIALAETAFAADALSVQQAFARFKVTPQSMVFPRNQWSPEALEVLNRLEYLCYRGNENHFLYHARSDFAMNNWALRGLRLLDHYCNISGSHTFSLRKLNPDPQKLINLPASRFLRPYSKYLKPFEPLRLRRIKRAMTRAAKRDECFHLWWHPHNFGINQTENFAMLEAILDHYKKLEERYEWQSANMAETATTYRESA